MRVRSFLPKAVNVLAVLILISSTADSQQTTFRPSDEVSFFKHYYDPRSWTGEVDSNPHDIYSWLETRFEGWTDEQKKQVVPLLIDLATTRTEALVNEMPEQPPEVYFLATTAQQRAAELILDLPPEVLEVGLPELSRSIQDSADHHMIAVFGIVGILGPRAQALLPEVEPFLADVDYGDWAASAILSAGPRSEDEARSLLFRAHETNTDLAKVIAKYPVLKEEVIRAMKSSDPTKKQAAYRTLHLLGPLDRSVIDGLFSELTTNPTLGTADPEAGWAIGKLDEAGLIDRSTLEDQLDGGEAQRAAATVLLVKSWEGTEELLPLIEKKLSSTDPQDIETGVRLLAVPREEDYRIGLQKNHLDGVIIIGQPMETDSRDLEAIREKEIAKVSNETIARLKEVYPNVDDDVKRQIELFFGKAGDRGDDFLDKAVQRFVDHGDLSTLAEFAHNADRERRLTMYKLLNDARFSTRQRLVIGGLFAGVQDMKRGVLREVRKWEVPEDPAERMAYLNLRVSLGDVDYRNRLEGVKKYYEERLDRAISGLSRFTFTERPTDDELFNMASELLLLGDMVADLVPKIRKLVAKIDNPILSFEYLNVLLHVGQNDPELFEVAKVFESEIDFSSFGERFFESKEGRKFLREKVREELRSGPVERMDLTDGTSSYSDAHTAELFRLYARVEEDPEEFVATLSTSPSLAPFAVRSKTVRENAKKVAEVVAERIKEAPTLQERTDLLEMYEFIYEGARGYQKEEGFDASLSSDSEDIRPCAFACMIADTILELEPKEISRTTQGLAGLSNIGLDYAQRSVAVLALKELGQHCQNAEDRSKALFAHLGNEDAGVRECYAPQRSFEGLWDQGATVAESIPFTYDGELIYGKQFHSLLLRDQPAGKKLYESTQASLARDIDETDRLEVGVGGSAMSLYALATSVLAMDNPPEFGISRLKEIDQRFSSLPYSASLSGGGPRFEGRREEGDTSERAAAARAVPFHLALLESESNPKERLERRDDLTKSILGYVEALPALLAHAIRDYTHLGTDGLAPYYYYSTIPYVTAAISRLRAERKDPNFLERESRELYEAVISSYRALERLESRGESLSGISNLAAFSLLGLAILPYMGDCEGVSDTSGVLRPNRR